MLRALSVPQLVVQPVMYGEASDIEDKGFCDVIEDIVVNKPSSHDMEPTVFQPHRLGYPVHGF